MAKHKRFVDPKDGEILSVLKLAKKYNVSYAALWDRLYNRNLTVSEALTYKRIYTGDKTKHELYTIWISIKGRCNTPSDSSYERYGAKGVTICERWITSFENFLEDMGERPTGYHIDRIDSSKGYEPDNCRWVTQQQNNMNRRKFKDNTSGYKGVSIASYMKNGKIWRAAISYNKKTKLIGYFKTKTAAAKAYDKAAKKYFGEYAILNFP